MRTHIYNFTLSSCSPETARALVAALPTKYKVTEYGTTICCYERQEDGASRIAFYLMDAKRADALRKWFYRRSRYKTGRGTFARLVTKSAPPAPEAPAA